jgi:ADP-ribose pyrophosphatase YjhB (NUDIX family)
VVDDEGRILLARRAREPRAALWDVPGGFLEPAESPEEGVRRELLEETGLRIEVGRYVGSFVDVYGDGGDTTLNIFFECRVLDGTMRADDDVSELRWFAPDALPPEEEFAFPNSWEGLAAWRALRG